MSEGDETAERGREDVAIKLHANGPTSALSCLNRPISSFSAGDSYRFNLLTPGLIKEQSEMFSLPS